MMQVTSRVGTSPDQQAGKIIQLTVLQDEAMADLEKRDTPLPRGMVDPVGTARRIRVERYKPSPRLAPFVDNIWIIDWDLTGRSPEVQKVLSSPNANLVLGPGRSGLFGVIRGISSQTLEGRGKVVGLRFRSGGLRPFLSGPVAALTDRMVPLQVVTGIDDQETKARVLAQDGHRAMVQAVEALLERRLPEPDPTVDLVCAAVALARCENGPMQAEALAGATGIGLRTLQRLFREYVGVSPKWVIRRYRLQEAAVRLAKGSNEPLADLAASLGYFDQSHLARDFTQLFGCPPSEYQQSQIVSISSKVRIHN
jgi:AraC-like DNA-binding protein